MSTAIYGELIRAGTFAVHPDGPMPGLHIVCTEAELSAIKKMPMYRRVAVVPVEDFPALAREIKEHNETRAQSLKLAAMADVLFACAEKMARAYLANHTVALSNALDEFDRLKKEAKL